MNVLAHILVLIFQFESTQNSVNNGPVCCFLKECERKQTDYTSKAEELRKKYDATCKQMGIEV